MAHCWDGFANGAALAGISKCNFTALATEQGIECRRFRASVMLQQVAGWPRVLKRDPGNHLAVRSISSSVSAVQ